MPHLENKEFDLWNSIKKEINIKITEAFPKRREIWLVNYGKNVGFEINGKSEKFYRPVLILKKLSKNVFLILPLTSKEKKGTFCFSIQDKSHVLFDQIRVMDKKRFIYKMRIIPIDLFNKIHSQCKRYLFGEVSFVEPAHGG